MQIFLVVFSLVFLAELADKTQILVLFLSSRYKKYATITGVLISSAILMALSVFPVKYIQALIELKYLKIISGILFITFGVISFLKKEQESGIRFKTFKMPAWLLVTVTFFIAEIGDRTQLAGITMAMTYTKHFAVWLGAWAGLFLANLPVIFMGHYITNKIKPAKLEKIGGILFVAFGLFILIKTLFFEF